MGKRITRRRPSKSPQVGDMRTRITIHSRKKKAPGIGSASHSEPHTLIDTVWSSHETLRGDETFSGVDSNANPSDLFMIRYRDDVSVKNIIGLDDQNYKILSTDNSDKRNRFLFLPCELLGDSSKSSNQ